MNESQDLYWTKPFSKKSLDDKVETISFKKGELLDSARILFRLQQKVSLSYSLNRSMFSEFCGGWSADIFIRMYVQYNGVAISKQQDENLALIYLCCANSPEVEPVC